MSPTPDTIDVMTRYGLLRCFPEDRWLSRSLQLLGEWSEEELDYIKMFLEILATRNGGPVDMVDGGAFVGEHVIPLSQYCRKIYAFEPQRRVREVLQHNLEVNKVTNVEVMPFALGDKNDTIYYPNRAENGDDLVGTQMSYSPSDNPVEMRTLDSFGLTPGFLKADIEGMELAMLAGGLQTLAKTRCPVFLECDTVFQAQPPQLDEALQQLGYSTRKFFFPMWSPKNFNGTKVNPFDVTISKMILGLPPVNG